MAQADEHAGLSTATGDEGRKTWVAAGGILGAIAASSCCILPLVLFSLGIGDHDLGIRGGADRDPGGQRDDLRVLSLHRQADAGRC